MTLQQPPTLSSIGTCDVVASVGVMTQLIDAVVKSVGESHHRFWDVVSAIRLQHLLLMLQLTRGNGAAVLVTEEIENGTEDDLFGNN